MQEAEKREQFRAQFFSFLLLQAGILVVILTGLFTTTDDGLYLYPIRTKRQAAWGGLMWLMALTLLFVYLVRSLPILPFSSSYLSLSFSLLL